MIRRTAAAAAAALAALASLGACTSNDSTTSTADPTTTQPSDATSPPPDEPIDLTQVPDDTALEPGKYSVAFLAVDSHARAIVDVPEGYVSASAVRSSGPTTAIWPSGAR